MLINSVWIKLDCYVESVENEKPKGKSMMTN